MITPAITGPFDLGTVVVRVALFVDPETARIRPLLRPDPRRLRRRQAQHPLDRRQRQQAGLHDQPDELRQARHDRRDQGRRLRPDLAKRPSAPSPSSTPFSPPTAARSSSARSSSPRCSAAASHAAGPRTRNSARRWSAASGDANLRQAAVTLPKALILDQSHIKTICTRPQLAAGACPKGSIYGHAAATSPLIGKPLSGPVYLVPSTHILPDLLVDLHGQVDVRLRGAVESVKAAACAMSSTRPPTSRSASSC